MGQPTDGTNAGNSTYPTPPFPVPRAPQILIVTFTGIERTAYGTAQGAPPPPNRHFLAERTETEEWHCDGDVWHFAMESQLQALSLLFSDPVLDNPIAFECSLPAPPIFAGDNELWDPETQHYTGGQVAISWMEHFGPDSIWFLMDAFGLDYSDPTMLEQIPQLLQKSTIRFADQRDGTCIRIKIDKNWGKFLPIPLWTYNAATDDLKLLLTFPKAMDTSSTPSKNDFVYCNYYEDDILAVSCAWTGGNVLEVHFNVPVIPTEDAWTNYTKGTYPIKFYAGGEYDSWNHMFFP